MIHTTQTNATKFETAGVADAYVSPAKSGVAPAGSTKDAGRVHVGGGMMRFDSTKDAGRVHVGGGMMRF